MLETMGLEGFPGICKASAPHSRLSSQVSPVLTKKWRRTRIGAKASHAASEAEEGRIY